MRGGLVKNNIGFLLIISKISMIVHCAIFLGRIEECNKLQPKGKMQLVSDNQSRLVDSSVPLIRRQVE